MSRARHVWPICPVRLGPDSHESSPTGNGSSSIFPETRTDLVQFNTTTRATQSREGKEMGTGRKGGDQKGLLWRLPEVTSRELGKIGPAFGLGIGCGAGAGIGFFGGAGLGYGFPGLTLGFGVGAGCGVGFGFGYGLGKGIAYDEKKRFSNVGKMFQEAPNLPKDTVVALFDELVVNTKKLASATSKEIEKWR